MTTTPKAASRLSGGGPARIGMVVAAAATFLLYTVPYGRYVAYPLLLVSTYVHEMGHGVAAGLVGARFESFVMHMDGSGVANIRGEGGRLASAAIAAGGLLGPALLAALLFVASARAQIARFALGVFGLASLVALLWVVRNPFGWLFVGLLAAGSILIAVRFSPPVGQFSLAFLAVQLALSVFSRADYLFSPTAATADGTYPSDVALMARALLLPYWFWGALCAATSLTVMVWGLKTFWRATHSRDVSATSD